MRLVITVVLILLLLFQTGISLAEEGPTVYPPEIYKEISRPWYKKWWVWTLILLVAGGGAAAAAAGGGGGNNNGGGGSSDTGTVTITGPGP